MKLSMHVPSVETFFVWPFRVGVCFKCVLVEMNDFRKWWEYGNLKDIHPSTFKKGMPKERELNNRCDKLEENERDVQKLTLDEIDSMNMDNMERIR